jgi:hypothetical protein
MWILGYMLETRQAFGIELSLFYWGGLGVVRWGSGKLQYLNQVLTTFTSWRTVLGTMTDNPAGVRNWSSYRSWNYPSNFNRICAQWWCFEITFEVASSTNFSTYRRTGKQIKHVRTALEQRGKKMPQILRNYCKFKLRTFWTAASLIRGPCTWKEM